MTWFNRGPKEDSVHLMFICVKNAGRSQIAAGFARRECKQRNLTDKIEVHSTGTHPVDEIPAVVVETMAERDIDISDQKPRLVELEELQSVDYLVRMGCYIAEFNPALYGVDSQEWTVADPNTDEQQHVRTIRDEIEQRVIALFDEIEADLV
jgi:arsenate reductase (thioredoxin)